MPQSRAMRLFLLPLFCRFNFLISTLVFAFVILPPSMAFSSPVQDSPSQIQTLCPLAILAHRTGKENCWVQYPLDHQRRLCIHHRAWLNRLKSPDQWMAPCVDTAMNEAAINWSTANWKASSPLLNSTDSKHSSLLSHSLQNKPIRYTQYITHFIEQKNTYATGYLSHKILYNKIIKTIERQREEISELLTPYDHLGILRSLLLNQGSSKEPLPFFRRLGFVHLISATGIHLYAWMRTWDRGMQFLFLTFHLPVRWGIWISRMSSGIGCLWIWLLAGAKIGMFRPWLILLARELAQAFGFRWRKASPLAIALTLDLLVAFIRSWQGHSDSFSSGRWIYALAVGGGLLWCKTLRFTHVGLAIGSWLFVALWEIWDSGMIAIATPLMSLVTLPLICCILYPILLSSTVLLFFGLPHLAHFWVAHTSSLLNGLILKLSAIALYPWNLWLIPRRTLMISIALSAILFTLQPIIKRKIKRSNLIFIIYMIIIFIVILFKIKFSSPPPPIASRPTTLAEKVNQLDVGQGDAALVFGKNPGMIDTGSQRALSETQWLHIFSERQIHHLSWIALTHLDEDHSGGILRLSKIIPIDCIVTSTAELETPKGQTWSRNLAQHGLKVRDWSSSCIPYPTLAPLLSDSKSIQSRNKNMGAVWIPLKSGGFYLSAGDASASDEIRIGHWAHQLFQSLSHPPFSTAIYPRILKISHHGSKYSTSDDFLNLIQPTEAWISVGKGNRYGHPSLSVLKALIENHIPIRRTDQEGVLISP